MPQQQQQQANKLKHLLNKLKSDLFEAATRLDDSNNDKKRELDNLKETEIAETAILSSIAKAKYEMKKTKKHIENVRSKIDSLQNEHCRLEAELCAMEWTCFDLIRSLFRDFDPNANKDKKIECIHKTFYENRKDHTRLKMFQGILQIARSYLQCLCETRATLQEKKENLDFQTKMLQLEAQRVRDTIVMFEDKLTSLDVTLQIETEKRDFALERLSALEQMRNSSSSSSKLNSLSSQKGIFVPNVF